jgi:uncharacterized protein (DUF305 family)
LQVPEKGNKNRCCLFIFYPPTGKGFDEMNIKILCLAVILAFAPVSAMAHDMSKASEATKAYMQPMKDMQDKMASMTPTGDADRDFVMMMKPHHQAAIDMAKAYLEHGNDPKLKAMAENIVASQQKEIREMDDWEATHK